MTADGMGLIIRGTLIYHNCRGKIISERKNTRLRNTGMYEQTATEGGGDTLNFKLRSYKSSLYRGIQLPSLTFRGTNDKLITPGDKNRPIIFAFWTLGCGFDVEILDVLDSLAQKYSGIDIIAPALFPKAEEYARSHSWKNLQVIVNYKPGYNEYFPACRRLLVMTDQDRKIKRFYNGSSLKWAEEIESFLSFLKY